ncbi:DNA mismatch endonuclease Vsr [Halovulum dunhuangense]|uniref:Very short patch repair endonuclease n=1 Tax=Halovulum dunhuangense TaxID=1505036 RepID=A0A849L4U4_9RHOB|nr:DNA mismatch endonuclease Vsr [Halovulum dunhuangense]
MTDIVDAATRSRIMRAVPRSSTKPEIVLRKRLHALGLRYVLGGRGLPGSPDLVLPRWTAAVFVHGCFWHRHPKCRYTTMPSTRPEFWQAKFEANVARDNAVRATLLAEGWRVATVWECALRKPERAELAADMLAAWLRDGVSYLELAGSDSVLERLG